MPVTAAPKPSFEAFHVEVAPSASLAAVRRGIATELGRGWKLERLVLGPVDYELRHAKPQLSVPAAWEASYRLAALPGVVLAEPLFEVPMPAEEPPAARGLGAAAQEGHVPESAPHDWSLKQLRVPAAWKRWFGDPAREAGAGISVFHPDTGFTEHEEIVHALDTSRAWNFVDDDGDATDPVRRPVGVILPTPGHGTSTASVIAAALAGDLATGITGTAPAATVVPIRMTRSVVLFSMRNLSRAIEHAAAHGAHVVSMSLGGWAARACARPLRSRTRAASSSWQRPGTACGS